jgi:hypothetical protein
MDRFVYFFLLAALIANAACLALYFHLWTTRTGRRSRLGRNLTISSAGIFLALSSILLAQTNVITRPVAGIGALAALVLAASAVLLMSRDDPWRPE